MKNKEYYLREREKIHDRLFKKYGKYTAENAEKFNAEYKKEIRKLYGKEQK